MGIFKTVETENNILEIHYDEMPGSPREWDNLGTIVAWHRRYNLSDTIVFVDNDDFIQEVKEKDNIILPVYMYDHSGICLNTTGFSCPWDSGQVGWIYVSKEKIRKEYNAKRISKKLTAKVESILKGEIETYSQYLEGDVYGFILKDKEGKEKDSCWGFFGSDFKNNGLIGNLPKEFADLI